MKPRQPAWSLLTNAGAATAAAAIFAVGLTAASPAEAARELAAAPATDHAPAASLAATAPPNADPARTYDGPDEALLEADLDYLVREARRAVDRGEDANFWPTLVFVDHFAAGRYPDARRVLEGAPGGVQGGVADLLEPFLLAAEGRIDFGVERVEHAADQLPAPLPDIARALIFESAGRLQEASAIYSQMREGLDVTPPPESEPTNAQEFERSLNAARTTHALYRAALVQHRLGDVEGARALYADIEKFAPRSADVAANLVRLNAGQPPIETPLDITRAAGRWLLFLSEFLTQAEMLQDAVAGADPEPGLTSSSGMMLLQLGIALEPGADDWRLYAADALSDAGGLDGAQRVIDGMSADSVFAPDAELLRAQIFLEREDEAQARAAVDRVMTQAGDRWSLIASAGDVYRMLGMTRESVAAFNSALSRVSSDKDRADVLGWRAFAHHHGGEVAAATADARAALALDHGVDTRLLFVSILMEDPQGWRDGVREARALFSEQPDSVMRLNALGYALIQRPEGLEEGYRLLWRGFSFNPMDYAVVDSLGWAYYLHGAFDEARALIERANELSAANPNPEVLDHLGDIYWRLERRDEARAAWREGLEARPDVRRRRNLEAKLERGLTTPAPRKRPLPTVSLPDRPGETGDL